MELQRMASKRPRICGVGGTPGCRCSACVHEPLPFGVQLIGGLVMYMLDFEGRWPCAFVSPAFPSMRPQYQGRAPCDDQHAHGAGPPWFEGGLLRSPQGGQRLDVNLGGSMPF